MSISGSKFKRFTDIYNAIRWTNNGVCRFTNTSNITTIRTDRITTFRHWTLFYRNRKKLKNKSIHLDLTKSRLSLLNEARKLIENNEDIAFCYADINCRCKLQFKNNDDFFFESLDVLKSKLSGYSNNSNEWICVANGYCFDFKVCFS